MERLKYLDFDLLIERAHDRYRAYVLHSPAGQASVSFDLPFTEQDLEILMLRVGRARRGVRRIESPEMQAAKQFGGKLFDAVFSGDVRGALRSSADTANREGAGLRVRLRLADAPELVDLPWEFLYNASLNRFLALSNKTPLVRYIELPETPRPLKITPPLRILVMISSPGDYEPLDVEREWQKLNDALRELIAENLVTLDRLDRATLGALRQKLRQQQYHVLHFVGHGGFDAQAQDGVLVLEDEQGRGRRASGQFLATVLTDRDSLRLVVLNACEGARTARSDPFAGVAQSLVQQGIPAVVAMQFEITDEASIAFGQEFYAALADGYPVDAALGDARGAIFAHVNDLEWGTPVLYLRAPDGMIFAPPSPEERVEREQLRIAGEQRARAQEQTRLAQELRIASLWNAAQDSFAKNDLDAAATSLGALLALDGLHANALAMQKNILAASEKRKAQPATRSLSNAPLQLPERAAPFSIPSHMPERAMPAPLPPAHGGTAQASKGFFSLYAILIAAVIVLTLLMGGAFWFRVFDAIATPAATATPQDSVTTVPTGAALLPGSASLPAPSAATVTRIFPAIAATAKPTAIAPTRTNTSDSLGVAIQATATAAALAPGADTPQPTLQSAPVRTLPPRLANAQFDFETPLTWTLGNQKYGALLQSAEQFRSGKFSGKLAYNFPAVVDEYLVLMQKRALPFGTNAMTVWVYGDGSGHYLNAWVTDSAGTKWAFTFGRVLHKGWKQMTAKFDLSPGWPNSAIAPENRTVVTLPMLTFEALVLDAAPHGQASQGAIYIDDLAPAGVPGATAASNVFVPAACEIIFPSDIPATGRRSVTG